MLTNISKSKYFHTWRGFWNSTSPTAVFTVLSHTKASSVTAYMESIPTFLYRILTLTQFAVSVYQLVCRSLASCCHCQGSEHSSLRGPCFVIFHIKSPTQVEADVKRRILKCVSTRRCKYVGTIFLIFTDWITQYLYCPHIVRKVYCVFSSQLRQRHCLHSFYRQCSSTSFSIL
jgi:hypothetical protein